MEKIKESDLDAADYEFIIQYAKTNNLEIYKQTYMWLIDGCVISRKRDLQMHHKFSRVKKPIQLQLFK